MDIKLILKAITSIGITTGRDAIQYSIYRDFCDSFSVKHIKNRHFRTPGKVLNRQTTPDGAVINYQHAKLTVNFFSDSLVKVLWEPGKLPLPYTIASAHWEKPSISSDMFGNETILSSKACQLIIGDSGGIKFCTSDGNILRTDLPPQKSGPSWQLITHLRNDEHMYGLGERASHFNLIGKSYQLWNKDPGGSYTSGNDPLYICTPVLMALGSSGFYLVYFDNTHPATIDLQSISTVQFSGGALCYYFIHGTPQELLAQYTTLTGRPPLPPRWVLGYHQSRWGYRSAEEIRKVAAGFEAHQLPLSAIHLDIDYMDGYRVFTTDSTRFPDLHQLSNDLNEKGINLVTIIDPGVKKDKSYSIYRDGIQNKVFCRSNNNRVLHGVVWPGWAAYPDFTSEATRQWWGIQYRFYLNAGISGFWHDMNEPVSFTAWGENTIPRTTQHDMDGRHGDHLEAHNLYGFLMNKAAYEGLCAMNPDHRVWLISRSGWAGLQRYAWNWTGDIASTWEALRQTLITLMGLSLSGHYFSGSDIGGFSGNPSAELYLRWFQMSTFFPFFRTHSAVGTNRREPWAFGEIYTDIIRKYLNLRYQLIPYMYTLAWRSHKEGLPIIRPLFLCHPEWSSTWDIDDEFLLGDDLLIAPVLQSGSESRKVVLPPGDWYLMWSDAYYRGPTTITVPVSLEHVPIFVRAGCILPRENNDCLDLHLYPTMNLNAVGVLYSDSGDGFADWRVDKYECREESDELYLSHQVEGDYPFPYLKVVMILHGKPKKRAYLNGHLIDLTYAAELNL